MAKNSTIAALSADERKLLELCGITQDTQLARIGPAALMRDIKTAANIFADEEHEIPDISRLEYICRQAAAAMKLPQSNADALWENVGGRRMHNDVTHSDEPETLRYSAATGRMLVDDQLDTRQAISLDARRKQEDPRDFSHAICSQHPFAIYLGAWATLFVVAAVIVLLLSVAGLLIGIELERPTALILASGLTAAVLFYAIMVSMASCSTCRVSVFSFRRYPKHRKAHHIFLLGYTIATALYTIFFFRYRCPSCGTPQKLFGKRHRRRS